MAKSSKTISSFPDPALSDRQGIIAIGGDLSPQRLLDAYSHGIFPWYEPHSPILWWSPDPRLILIPNEFIMSHSLKKALKKSFRFTIDTVFSQVITSCATIPDRLGKTWITDEMIEAYSSLHKMGYAHSFEIWDDSTLIGGLYGISIGHAFFGESMFHTVTDASKIALYFLCKTMESLGFDFIDCQVPTKHLKSLGAKIISRTSFLDMLKTALENPTKKGNWSALFP